MSSRKGKGNLPAQQGRQQTPTHTTTHITQSVQITGPIPLPAVLQGYEAVQPGLAERIVRWTEEETAFRRSETVSMRRWGNFEALLGMGLAFALAVIAIIIGFRLLMADKSVGGIAAIIGAMVPLITAFFVVRRKRS